MNETEYCQQAWKSCDGRKQMNQIRRNRMPDGYVLIRYGLFCWGWRHGAYVSMDTKWTAWGCIKYAWAHHDFDISPNRQERLEKDCNNATTRDNQSDH